MKIIKGDKVEVISGNDKGKQGLVEKVLPKQRKVIVEGVQVVKKHVKQKSQQKPGGIIKISKPIHASKVKLVCPSCSKLTRVGFKNTKAGKVRICKRCNVEIKK